MDLIWNAFPEKSQTREANPTAINGGAVPVGKRKKVNERKMKKSECT